MRKAALAALVALPLVALAQAMSPGYPRIEVTGGPVVVQSPDGGTLRVGVEDSVRLDVSATQPPDTSFAVSGPGGARLEVDLGPSALTLLAGRTCSYGPLGHILVDAGVTELPGMAGRTGILVVGHAYGNGVDYVSCWPGVGDGGPLPNCTMGSEGVGLPIHDMGSVSFDVSNAYTVRCTVCSHSGGSGSTTAIVSGANSQCTP